MTAVQDTLQGFQKLSQKNALVCRLSRALNQHILPDFKVLFQPGQAPAPLVIAVALGTILSFIPAPLLDSLLVGVIFARFRQVNKSALLAARIVWNDLVVVPLYVPGFRFGMRLVEPFTVNDTTLAIKIIGFSLGLVLLTAAATIASAAIMVGFISVLRLWQNSPSRDGRSFQDLFKQRSAARTGLPSPPVMLSGNADNS